ncbi:hypothetical protein KZ877_24475, partial [Pseudomonas aeruginosa]|nr:hypothetical protein [Pseudomonas aeruginosa]
MHQSLGVVDEQATGRDARFHPANESLSQISASARHKYIFNCFRSAICSGQPIPDSGLSFSSATAGGNPSLN